MDNDNDFDFDDVKCGVARGLSVCGWFVLAVGIITGLILLKSAIMVARDTTPADSSLLALGGFGAIFCSALLSYLLRGFAILVKSAYFIAKKQGML